MRYLALDNLAVADRRMYDVVKWYTKPPKDINMRIPDEIRTCVVYIGIVVEGEEPPKIHYGGTGFLIAVMAKKVPGAAFMFLVTAKHVAEGLADRKWYIRANTINGNSADVPVSPDAKWFYHPTDTAADVALIPLGLSPEHFKFNTLQPPMFLTETMRIDMSIGVGDEVFISGMFIPYRGITKNIPIVRIGNIAMIPEGERIPTKDFGNMEAFLIESRSIGGLSGSPVFCIGIDKKDRKPYILLMGLIHGHYSISFDTFVDDTKEDASGKAGLNMGIAIVTPAQKILDIVFGAEISKMTDEYEEKEASQYSPIPDGSQPLDNQQKT